MTRHQRPHAYGAVRVETAKASHNATSRPKNVRDLSL